MVANHTNILKNDKIKAIICSWTFFNELKILSFILEPLSKTILDLERKAADLSDCYLGLAYISLAIKKLPRNFNIEFRNYCIQKINDRFREFDDDYYLIAFFLNPLFRGWLVKNFLFVKLIILKH